MKRLQNYISQSLMINMHVNFKKLKKTWKRLINFKVTENTPLQNSFWYCNFNISRENLF